MPLPVQFSRAVPHSVLRNLSGKVPCLEGLNLVPKWAGIASSWALADIEYNEQDGSWTGRSPRPFWHEHENGGCSCENGRGGKSELHRAVCRITSGRMGSSPFDGKCHRKHTAPLILGDSSSRVGGNGRGKG